MDQSSRRRKDHRHIYLLISPDWCQKDGLEDKNFQNYLGYEVIEVNNKGTVRGMAWV